MVSEFRFLLSVRVKQRCELGIMIWTEEMVHEETDLKVGMAHSEIFWKASVT